MELYCEIESRAKAALAKKIEQENLISDRIKRFQDRLKDEIVARLNIPDADMRYYVIDISELFTTNKVVVYFDHPDLDRIYADLYIHVKDSDTHGTYPATLDNLEQLAKYSEIMMADLDQDWQKATWWKIAGQSSNQNRHFEDAVIAAYVQRQWAKHLEQERLSKSRQNEGLPL